ncbi:hypothetical protein CLV98_103364 [Dyadobacter jejuensis]|uniref:Uncharacterized protein n=1 Tax=Dyadobacter jejuensis TaxID=1082580 RepID=A0A316ANC6_9BACT|nr:hypothetical protein [Dyadobacter jejuensis]PWJ58991.1 hypothetical protein CLV98_103364 [Dyadobacter jejuensis]
MENYRQFGGLGVNWLVFGSSGHLHKAEVPQLYRFLMRSDLHFLPNRHIKSIVQPRHVKAAYQPHYFRYKKGRFCINENGSPIVGYESEVSVDKIQINHYYCRSKEEYREKINRGRSDIEESRSMDAFYAHDKDANVVEDRTILKVLSGWQGKEN